MLDIVHDCNVHRWPLGERPLLSLQGLPEPVDPGSAAAMPELFLFSQLCLSIAEE